ncbi:hypothetical protein ABPG74_021868 [Tetrahymena malaccensis]
MEKEIDLQQIDTREFENSQNNSFYGSQFEEVLEFNQQKSIRDGDNNRKRWVTLQNDNVVKRISEESVKQIEIIEISDTQSNNLNYSYAKKNFEFKQNTQELNQSKDNSALAKFFKNSNDQDSMIKSRKPVMSQSSQDGVNSALLSLYEDKKAVNSRSHIKFGLKIFLRQLYYRVVFGLNTLIIMNTAYYENGIIQENRSSIMLHFIKHHLAVELITNSCLWFNPLGIRVLRVLFMIKVLTFYDIIEKFTESVQFSPKYNLCIKLATLLVEVIILCHLFACIWYSLGNYQESNGIYQNWLRSENLQDQQVRTKYISSLYFSVITIGTIGYGDILPQNEIERGVLAAMAIMACGIFAYILSNIQNVYRKYNQKQKAYIKSLTDLNNFMTNRSVNPILQQMARKYLKYIHDQNFRKGEVPCESLNVLSKHLREEITSEIFNKTINQIKFFKQFSQQLKQQLAQRMTEYTYGPDEIIFKMNSLQEPQIIFVLKGSIEISIDQGKYFKYNQEKQKEPFHICKPSQTIGEYEFVSQSQVSSFNARSIGITTTHQIKLSEFLEILKQHSNDRETYQQLKDSLNLYDRYHICNIYCYSCKSSKHLTNECPLFFYKPNKLRIVNLENKNLQNNIRNFQRSMTRLKFSSLIYQKGIAITSLAYKQENADEISVFSSNRSLEESQDDKKINNLQQARSQKILSNCDEGAFENISSQEILAPKKDQDFKIFTETPASQLNPKDNLSEIKISFLELQIEKSQNKSQFMPIQKKFKELDDKQQSSKKIDEENCEINSKLADATSKKAHKRRTNITSQFYPFQTKNSNNQQVQKEEMQEDDLITETMRSYTRYMIHNNIEIILRKIRISGFKGKEKTKKINFSKC